MSQLAAGHDVLVANDCGKRWQQMLADGELNAVFTEIVGLGTQNPQEIAFLYDARVFRSAWERIADAAAHAVGYDRLAATA